MKPCPNWEIPRSKLQLDDNHIGAGFFGIVYKGIQLVSYIVAKKFFLNLLQINFK